MAFEARISLWRSVLLVVVAIMGILGGLVLVGLIGLPPLQVGGLVYGAGWIAVVIFGVLTIAWGRRLLRSGVEVRIDGSGVLFRRWSNQTIPWIAIERVAMMRAGSQRIACLHLLEPSAFPSITMLGKLAGVNKSLGMGDVVVSVSGTDQSPDAMLAAFARFAPDRLRD